MTPDVVTGDAVGPHRHRTEPPTRTAVWRPVEAEGRVVDLVLIQVADEDRAELGMPEHGALGARMTTLFPDATVDGRLAAFCAVAETGQPIRTTRPATAHRSAVVLAVHLARDGDVVVRIEPAVEGAAGTTRDQHRWQRLFDDTPLGVFVVTPEGRVLEVNRAGCAMLDRRADQLVGTHLRDIAHPDDPTQVDEELLDRTGHATLLRRYVRGDGGAVWLRAALSLVVEDGVRKVLGIVEDVTEAQLALAELAHRADHDPLTDLANREALRRRLKVVLSQVRRGAVPGVGLLFLDLDRFKVINDSLGHAVGDRLLRAVADRLRATVADGDLLARLGGDEFAVLTRDPEQAPVLGRRLVEALQVPFALDGRDLTVGASIGVAVTMGGATDWSRPVPDDDLLREADTAMYVAKRAGQGPVVVFEETLRRRAVARLEDEQGLRRALQDGELRVHYQPIQRLPGLRTVGFEALVRWEHPDRGLLGPGQFLHMAEETGLVVPLGRLVLQQACATLARLRAAGAAESADLQMSVNVSAQHLAAGTLLADIELALSDSGLPPSALTVEITEQTLVASHTVAAEVLADLRAQGCRVALDDFGTGYSSLAYLRMLPVDVLKIDRTFVTGAGTSSHDGALLTAIAALGRSLGLQTVLEGIETPAELEAGIAAGATYAQGYLLGRPVPL